MIVQRPLSALACALEAGRPPAGASRPAECVAPYEIGLRAFPLRRTVLTMTILRFYAAIISAVMASCFARRPRPRHRAAVRHLGMLAVAASAARVPQCPCAELSAPL